MTYQAGCGERRVGAAGFKHMGEHQLGWGCDLPIETTNVDDMGIGLRAHHQAILPSNTSVHLRSDRHKALGRPPFLERCSRDKRLKELRGRRLEGATKDESIRLHVAMSLAFLACASLPMKVVGEFVEPFLPERPIQFDPLLGLLQRGSAEYAPRFAPVCFLRNQARLAEYGDLL